MAKWKVPTTKVKLLPATPLVLVKVFSHENTPIHRNELVSILDEMYRQNVIGPIEYRQINNKLAHSIGSEFEESLMDAENQSIGEKLVIDESTDEENDENEDELLRMINLTFNHIVQDDKEELIKLIDELKEILTSDTLLELIKLIDELKEILTSDTLLQLEKLIDELKEILTSDTLLHLEKEVGEFLMREQRDGKPILPITYDLLREPENSSIPLSKQLLLKMLIADIDQNRYRVKSVLKWLDGAEDNEHVNLKRLTREELLSEEQFKKLSALEDLTDLEAVADIVRKTQKLVKD